MGQTGKQKAWHWVANTNVLYIEAVHLGSILFIYEESGNMYEALHFCVIPWRQIMWCPANLNWHDTSIVLHILCSKSTYDLSLWLKATEMLCQWRFFTFNMHFLWPTWFFLATWFFFGTVATHRVKFPCGLKIPHVWKSPAKCWTLIGLGGQIPEGVTVVQEV